MIFDYFITPLYPVDYEADYGMMMMDGDN